MHIRAEIESRQEEVDQLRRRVTERAHIDADLAQRRFMLVDPGNRLVADLLTCWRPSGTAAKAARSPREVGLAGRDDLFRDR